MPEFDLPPEQEDLLRPLGEPVAEFRAGRRHVLGLLMMCIVGFAAGLGFLALTFGAVFLVNNPFGAGLWHGFFKLGFIGLALLAATLQGIRRLRNVQGLQVIVFADGLARIQSGAIDTLLWSDVAKVWHVAAAGTHHPSFKAAYTLTLLSAGGKKFEFEEGLLGVRQLGELVEQYTLPHLFPPVLDACELGEEAAFGKVIVSRQGLNYGGALSWDRCETIEADQDLLIVTTPDGRNPFCKVPLREVPNVHVLIAFAEYIRKYAD